MMILPRPIFFLQKRESTRKWEDERQASPMNRLPYGHTQFLCKVRLLPLPSGKLDRHNVDCRNSLIYYDVKWAATWQNQQNECAPSEDSDQPGHPPSLIRVFAVCMKKAWVLSYPLSAQRRLWSDRADAQADLSLRWVHTYFLGFVMSRLIFWLLQL